MRVNQGIDNDVVRISVDGTWTLVSASRRGRTFTAPLRSRHHRRTAIRPRPSTACSSARACRGPTCPRRWWLPVRQREYHYSPGPRGCPGGGEGPPPDVDIDKETQTRSALPGQLITYRITVRNRGDAPVRGVRACDRAPRALRFVRRHGASATSCRPSAVPHDRSAGGRSAQDVPRHLPVAPDRHGGGRHQWLERERGHPHRVRAVTGPARRRRHPQCAATPGRQGRRDDQGADCSASLPGGAESPRARSLLR